MKNIFKLSFLSLFLVSMVSCSSDDENAVVSSYAAPTLISPESGTSIMLTEGLEENPALTLVWNHGNYSVPTEINYTVQVAMADTDFATPIQLGAATTNRVLTVNVGELNEKAIQAGLEPFEEGSLDVRVISSLGTANEMPMASNTLTINVTPFEAAVPEVPKLYLVGAPQAYYGGSAWSPQTGMEMRYIGNGTTKVFEAYVKIGVDDGLKFAGTQGEWSDVDAAGNYGMGATAGTIVNSGGAGDLKLAATDGEGLYYVMVDVDNLTYKAVKMNWGIIGDATANAWSSETPMTYDFANNKFTISTTLNAGELKFRSKNAGDAIENSEWKFNVGDSDPKVTYNAAAPNFRVTAGPHDIELSIDFLGNATVSGL
jgi:hypothetical protein